MPPCIEFITSLDDPRVDVFRNVRDADLRGRVDLFMAESELVLRRLLRTPARLHSILLSREKFTRLSPVMEHLPPTVPIYVADLALIHEIAAFHIHRGILAAGLRLEREHLTLDAVLGNILHQPSACLLLAEGITNVDNMGALFRNAAAFGVDGVILDPTCCDPLYRKAIRVSMGHALSIPYALSDDWHDDLRRLRNEWNMTLVAAESGSDAVPLWEMPRADRVAFVFGSEGPGLARETLALCHRTCTIPMAGSVSSINVAVASAVVLYEWRRSRDTTTGRQVDNSK